MDPNFMFGGGGWQFGDNWQNQSAPQGFMPPPLVDNSAGYAPMEQSFMPPQAPPPAPVGRFQSFMNKGGFDMLGAIGQGLLAGEDMAQGMAMGVAEWDRRKNRKFQQDLEQKRYDLASQRQEKYEKMQEARQANEDKRTDLLYKRFETEQQRNEEARKYLMAGDMENYYKTLGDADALYKYQHRNDPYLYNGKMVTPKEGGGFSFMDIDGGAGGMNPMQALQYKILQREYEMGDPNRTPSLAEFKQRYAAPNAIRDAFVNTYGRDPQGDPELWKQFVTSYPSLVDQAYSAMYGPKPAPPLMSGHTTAQLPPTGDTSKYRNGATGVSTRPPLRFKS